MNNTIFQNVISGIAIVIFTLFVFFGGIRVHEYEEAKRIEKTAQYAIQPVKSKEQQ